MPLEDVAQLAGVPREQLVRVVRITAFAGVLCELDSGQVAHSALSAQLVLKPSMLDAIMFMSETAAPTALHMVMATREHGDSQQPNKSAYNIAFKNSPPFATVCEQRTKLRRQMAAFDRLGMVAANDNVTDLLSSLDWAALGNATVVEACFLVPLGEYTLTLVLNQVGARSIKTVSTLAELFPSLRFVVQVCENGLNGHIPTVSSSSQQSVQETSSTLPSAATLVATMPIDKQVHVNSRIIIQQRTPGTPQIAGGAAIYILRLPVPSPTSQQDQILSRINVELRVHLDVLRASPTSMLIVVARLLPEPKTVDPSVEAVARSRDMLLHQLSNQRELGMQELVNIVNNVRDSVGRLVMIKKLIDHHSPIVALEVRFQAHPDYLVSGTNFGLWSSQSIGQEPNS